MSVTIGKDCIGLLKVVDLSMEVLEAFLVLKSTFSLLLKPCLSFHKFVMASFEFMITRHHLI